MHRQSQNEIIVYGQRGIYWMIIKSVFNRKFIIYSCNEIIDRVKNRNFFFFESEKKKWCESLKLNVERKEINNE